MPQRAPLELVREHRPEVVSDGHARDDDALVPHEPEAHRELHVLMPPADNAVVEAPDSLEHFTAHREAEAAEERNGIRAHTAGREPGDVEGGVDTGQSVSERVWPS